MNLSAITTELAGGGGRGEVPSCIAANAVRLVVGGGRRRGVACERRRYGQLEELAGSLFAFRILHAVFPGLLGRTDR